MQDIENEFLNFGPWSQFTVDLVVPFYNEENNFLRTHQANKRLERLFRINRYIYIDNGSKDGTRAGLLKLSKEDAKVFVVKIDVNKGYGKGMQAGFAAATGDYILTNHADMQFDSYSFFTTHIFYLIALKQATSIFPFRVNRALPDRLFSACLRNFAGLFFGQKIGDFNGHPKLLPRLKNKNELEFFPNGFAFDLAVYLKSRTTSSIALPVLQTGRLSGVSSWNRNHFARFKQISNWITAIIRLACFDRQKVLQGCRTNNTSPP